MSQKALSDQIKQDREAFSKLDERQIAALQKELNLAVLRAQIHHVSKNNRLIINY